MWKKVLNTGINIGTLDKPNGRVGNKFVSQFPDHILTMTTPFSIKDNITYFLSLCKFLNVIHSDEVIGFSLSSQDFVDGINSKFMGRCLCTSYTLRFIKCISLWFYAIFVETVGIKTIVTISLHFTLVEFIFNTIK